MRIWPPNAAKCCKNAGKFFPGVLEENRLGSINKEGSLKNEPPKGDLRGAATKLLKVVSLSIRRESVLLLLSSYKPYFISFYSLK